MYKPIRSLLFIGLTIPCVAWAQNHGISLSPVTLIAPVEVRSQAVTLTNHGDVTVRYQIDAYRWTQVDGQHRHEPTTDVMATPAIVEVPSKAARVVRAMRVQGQGQGTAYYRLMIRELPAPADQGSAVRMPINHNLALAFEPAAAVSPSLSASAQVNGYLLTNSGTRVARLTAIGKPGKDPWRKGALGWVLPGSSLLIEVAPEHRAAVLELMVNGKPVTVSPGQ